MSTNQKTVNQIRTLQIFRGLSKFEQIHLIQEAGIINERFNSDDKRATLLTELFYDSNGIILTREAARTIQKAYKNP